LKQLIDTHAFASYFEIITKYLIISSRFQGKTNQLIKNMILISSMMQYFFFKSYMMSNPQFLARDSNNVEYLAHIEINYFAMKSLVVSYMGRAGSKKCFVRGEKKTSESPGQDQVLVDKFHPAMLIASKCVHTHTLTRRSPHLDLTLGSTDVCGQKTAEGSLLLLLLMMMAGERRFLKIHLCVPCGCCGPSSSYTRSQQLLAAGNNLSKAEGRGGRYTQRASERGL
jgi:hypothetical protein